MPISLILPTGLHWFPSESYVVGTRPFCGVMGRACQMTADEEDLFINAILLRL